MAYKLKVLSGALDVRNINGEERLVLRGVIDPACLCDIQVDDYQREEGSLSDLKGMIDAIKAGEQLPDVEIGIRGEKVTERNGVFYIDASPYMIDGLQRLSATKRVLLEMGMDFPVSFGALLHIGTTYEWELERFKILNLFRRRVSPNILLRNEKKSPAIQALLNLTTDHKEFVLRGRVSWGQKMGRAELITAFLVLKTIGVLHNQFGPGLSSSLTQLVPAIDKTYEALGPNVWRANVKAFFSAIDAAFQLRAIAYRDLSPQIKGVFLMTMARVFADHRTFWESNRLTVDAKDLQKLSQFPLRDPGIREIISSSSRVNEILYAKIVQHLNSGRRIRRLTKWDGRPADGILLDCVASDLDTGSGQDGPDFQDSTPAEAVTAT